MTVMGGSGRSSIMVAFGQLPRFDEFQSQERDPMNPEVKFERMGKFIYGACRHGGDISDVHHWMADEIGAEHPSEGDEAAQSSVQARYFAKYVSDEHFSESYKRFIKIMELR